MRPRFHFTAERGWINDPHGITARDGEYHSFFQYVPDSTVWVSSDWFCTPTSSVCVRDWNSVSAACALSSSLRTLGSWRLTNCRRLAASAELRATFWCTYARLICSSTWRASTGSSFS